MGVVVLALVGTISDLFTSVVFALANRMDLAVAMRVGSALQIALVVAPILALVSWPLGHPMNLGSRLDLFAVASAAIIVRAIAGDGETTWYEGFILVGVYVCLLWRFSHGACSSRRRRVSLRANPSRPRKVLIRL